MRACSRVGSRRSASGPRLATPAGPCTLACSGPRRSTCYLISLWRMPSQGTVPPSVPQKGFGAWIVGAGLGRLRLRPGRVDRADVVGDVRTLPAGGLARPARAWLLSGAATRSCCSLYNIQPVFIPARLLLQRFQAVSSRTLLFGTRLRSRPSYSLSSARRHDGAIIAASYRHSPTRRQPPLLAPCPRFLAAAYVKWCATSKIGACQNGRSLFCVCG